MQKSSKSFIILSICLVSTCVINAQEKNNPQLYSYNINRAELAICDSNYKDAIIYYKRAFNYLEEPFGEDLFNFLHCGYITEDEETINLCIPKYKERNYSLPFWIKDYRWTSIYRYADSLYTYHPATSKIDMSYRNFLLELEGKDQKVRQEEKNRINGKFNRKILKVDSINIAQLKRYIDSTGIFPTESIVGNWGNDAYGSLLIEYVLINYAADVGVESAVKNPVNMKLNERVLAGEFPPDLYAHLCDRRQYGLDGIFHANPSDCVLCRYGGTMSILVEKNNNPNFDFSDRKTWKMTPTVLKLTPEQEKQMNERRRKMNMESYQDFIKKVRYQMNLESLAFQLVSPWFTGFSFH